MGWARASLFFIPRSQFSLVVARLQWDCKCSCFASSIGTWSMTFLISALPSVASSSSSGLRLRASKVAVLRSFTGLSPPKPLLRTIASPEFSSFEHCFTTIDNGSRVFAMRHGRRVPKLPLTNSGALLQDLTTQLLRHGHIKTTRARAIAMWKYIDKMITLAKDGNSS
ncbi:unnamed protein product [Prunus armeniaca]|uniref:Uncharacterized protein n=1 Tax=Prunus armeniaca TaxID=36596 RepID=A0A6J5V2Y4_PRUAR|nr:unnamed protein product [Prunus armeniaca]